MKTGLIKIFSDLHDIEKIEKLNKSYTVPIKDGVGASEISTEEILLPEFEFIICFIMTGGSESKFQEIFRSLRKSNKKFILIASEADNSLPASIEILSWLNQKEITNCEGIIHGEPEKVITELKALIRIVKVQKAISGQRLGIIGKPSDWLIASTPDIEEITARFGLEFWEIPMDEMLEIFESFKGAHVDDDFKASFEEKYAQFSDNHNIFREAARIYSSLKVINKTYGLSGSTIRCFDLLNKFANTGCLAVSLLNDQGFPTACEGDVPALFSMVVANQLTLQPSFMANPSSVNSNSVTFAHCTVPIKILDSFELDTHFESNKGIAIKGVLKETQGTLFKIGGKNMSNYVALPGKIKVDEFSPNLCRTQLRFECENPDKYLLKKPLGNHHIIVPGNHHEILNRFCQHNGLIEVKP
jgi:L-fucose isomerase-like protein